MPLEGSRCPWPSCSTELSAPGLGKVRRSSRAATAPARARAPSLDYAALARDATEAALDQSPDRDRGGTPSCGDALLDALVSQPVFLGNGHGVGEAIRLAPLDPEGTKRGLIRNDGAHHRNCLRPERGELIDERHPNPQNVEIEDFSHHLLAEEGFILDCGRGEDLVQDNDGTGRRPFEDRPDPHQIVLELTSQVLHLLLALEMEEELVKQEKARLSARYRTP